MPGDGGGGGGGGAAAAKAQAGVVRLRGFLQVGGVHVWWRSCGMQPNGAPVTYEAQGVPSSSYIHQARSGWSADPSCILLWVGCG